jgi:prepilin-type N-terminal cleavage/methylation domain-containing protein
MKKNRRAVRNLEGFSLAEMVVTLFILSTLAAAGTAVFTSSQESLDTNYHRLILQQELRKILWTMSQEIRESSPSSPTPITTGTNSITFEIPNAVSGNQVTQWTQVHYGLAPDTTVTRTSNGQTTVMGNSVQSLNFVYPLDAGTAPRSVQIQITGSRNTLKRNLSVTLTGQVTLRNP